MQRLSFWILTGILLGLAGSPAGASASDTATRSFGAPPGGESCHGVDTGSRESYGDVVLRRVGDLALSDEQIGRITRIHLENQRKIRDIGWRLREARDSAYALFLAPSSSEAAIRQAARSHTAASDELVATALESRAAIDAVLTTEQGNCLLLQAPRPG